MNGTWDPAGVSGPVERVLDDGELLHTDHGWALHVGGVRQSFVDRAGRPPTMATTRWMLAALGRIRHGHVVHIGGGLLSLPRALSERGLAGHQHVVEAEPVIVGLARDRFGLPDGVELEWGDGRAWLTGPRAVAWRGMVDAVVIDVFVGGRIPPPFTTYECFAAARDLLAPAGLLLINSVIGRQLDFTRHQVATLESLFAHVGVVLQNSALKGLRFGNALLVASNSPLDDESVRRGLDCDASRAAWVASAGELVGGGRVVTDAGSAWSPVPHLPDLRDALRLVEQTRGLPAALKRDQ
jgi:spermidine synthase